MATICRRKTFLLAWEIVALFVYLCGSKNGRTPFPPSGAAWVQASEWRRPHYPAVARRTNGGLFNSCPERKEISWVLVHSGCPGPQGSGGLSCVCQACDRRCLGIEMRYERRVK
ncbi:hypothetical protein B0H66DRAFT_559894 [Apodospora peruviana]|uniref:Secreted protein n=1 Tax=Apodospora peruviana TaxID=516989 RepID=A0AAE0M2T4_9PEZI|nr:hypothetical protein B0H66DRAFT_559894 [Apodospora peruviana]